MHVRSSARLLGGAAAVLFFLAAGAGPAHAFRVFLDHNLDGDLTTFVNLVEGVETAPITFVVAFGPEDSTRTAISFDLSWDCHNALGLPVPHGDVAWDTLEDLYPFVNSEQTTCLAMACYCEAARYFSASLSTPVTSGFYEFTTLAFTRFPEYSSVQFQLNCAECSYLPGDAPHTVMTLIGPTANEAPSWGRVKSAYR